MLKDVMLNMIYSCRAKMEGLKMARPKNKQELIEAANTNYEKLLSMIERRTEAEKSAPYDFLDDEKKKEAHWRRDRNLRDVLMHLNE